MNKNEPRLDMLYRMCHLEQLELVDKYKYSITSRLLAEIIIDMEDELGYL